MFFSKSILVLPRNNKLLKWSIGEDEEVLSEMALFCWKSGLWCKRGKNNTEQTVLLKPGQK